MKTIHRFTHRVRSIIILGVALALGAAGTLRAQWSEAAVSGFPDSAYYDMGGCDSVWNIFWCGTSNGKLYRVQWSGGGFVASAPATNLNLFEYNCLAVDSTYHSTYYTGTDGYIWRCYWNGSAFVTGKVGSNLNNGSQLCVDSVWHILWYVGQDEYLWALYWNGSAWVESKIDGINKRGSGPIRACGVDEGYHWVWTLSDDLKSMVYTYYNGSAWVSAKTPALAGTDLYESLCVHPPTHRVYNLQTDLGGTPKQVNTWLIGGWGESPCWSDGNLPTSAGINHLVCAPDSYACYLGSGLGGAARCLFTGWSGTPHRNWASCRQDRPTWGGGSGLFPLCVGWGGRVALCAPGSGTGVKCMVSPY